MSGVNTKDFKNQVGKALKEDITGLSLVVGGPLNPKLQGGPLGDLAVSG